MSRVKVELYRTDDYVRAGEVLLVPLLQAVLEPELGYSLAGSRFELAFLAVADDSIPDGEPEVVNLRSGYGYVQVRVVRDGVVLYQHPHSVRELVARPLQRLLRAEDPSETHWGFGISGPGLGVMELVRPAPRVAGRIEVPNAPRRSRLFHLEEMVEDEPPTSTLSALGVRDEPTAAGAAGIGVVIRRAEFESLTRTAPFSGEVEEGGFLVGHVYRDEDDAARYLVDVTAAIPAERTGASLLQFTFTGESFLRINDRLTHRGRDEQLVGWYHTHLFQATTEVGLSAEDVELHTATFRRPWQLAGLVNIFDGSRMLRFYYGGDAAEGMTLAPYWVAGR